MPNPYIENEQRWLELSEVDYLGNFVKAWLAFNAWYRNNYTYTRDREIINEFKWHPNSVRNKLLPLISRSDEEAVQFLSSIGLLHHKLENNELYSGKGVDKERITLKHVYLKQNPIASQSGRKYGMSYGVNRSAIGGQRQIISAVTNKGGASVFNLVQQNFDLGELETHPDFITNLNANQQGYLMALYKNVNPRLVVDLTNKGKPAIRAGSYDFTCTPDELFAGVCEVIYLMRNSLFHGELVPCRDAAECYEPAYQIIRKILRSIS